MAPGVALESAWLAPLQGGLPSSLPGMTRLMLLRRLLAMLPNADPPTEPAGGGVCSTATQPAAYGLGAAASAAVAYSADAGLGVLPKFICSRV